MLALMILLLTLIQVPRIKRSSKGSFYSCFLRGPGRHAVQKTDPGFYWVWGLWIHSKNSPCFSRRTAFKPKSGWGGKCLSCSGQEEWVLIWSCSALLGSGAAHLTPSPDGVCSQSTQFTSPAEMTMSAQPTQRPQLTANKRTDVDKGGSSSPHLEGRAPWSVQSPQNSQGQCCVNHRNSLRGRRTLVWGDSAKLENRWLSAEHSMYPQSPNSISTRKKGFRSSVRKSSVTDKLTEYDPVTK